MIIQLDEYVEKGSELWLLNLVPVDERATLLKDKGNKEDLVLENLTIRNVVGNPIIRRDLINIKAVEGDTIALDHFDSILILSIEDGDNMMSSDSRALSSLLIIQDIQKNLKEKYQGSRLPCDPVAEILDSRTKSLLSVANCKGYIMSNQIISSVIAQVSEEKNINIVLKEILTAEGSETYIRPACRFANDGEELSFWDVALRARQLREVTVGYKPQNMTMKDAAHLIINPPNKKEKRKWRKGDVVVTFAID